MQDYSDMNYVDIIVKASLNLENAPKNVLLNNKDTQVSWDKGFYYDLLCTVKYCDTSFPCVCVRYE